MARRFLALTAVISALIAVPAAAQLSGAYTVDNTLPTGSGNYNSFTDAVTALVAQGVSAPVTMNVFNGAGPYVGFGIPTAITGASSTNTITFIAAPGNSPVVSGPAGANVQTIKLGTAATAGSGPNHIRLVGLTVQGAPSGAAILAAGCDNIRISGCTVLNCGTGIYFVFTVNSVIEDCDISGCGMTPGTPGAATYVGGITTYSSANFNLIQRNRVHDCPANGIFMGAGGSNTAQVWNNVVINNFVWNCPGASTYPGGIALRRITNSTVSNNSVVMPAGSNSNGLHITASTLAVTPPVGPAAEISNNIIRHEGTGACVGFDVTTAVVPLVFDYNHYDAAGTGPVGRVGTTNFVTLAAWQACTAPNLAGKEVNSIAGPAGFLSSTDLHITPASAAFNSGSTVALVADDIDTQPRPIAGIPDRGADETPASGLYASFTASPTSGPAALTVNFTDQSFTSDPMGVQSWAWDFQNDGINDAFTANPSFNYVVPGTYSVKLTVTDLTNPSSSLTRNNYITVSPYIFDAQTVAGTGSLSIFPIPNIGVPNTTSGFMFVSFTPPATLGTGPFFGLIPDSLTWSIAQTPASVGNVLHWTSAPGIFPNVPLILPAGWLVQLIGLTADFVQIDLTPQQTIANISNLDRITF
jgi:parallel beta-helix repeat protein